jgi:raffinose/stachyose/melibiose transport system substrate-binding protein
VENIGGEDKAMIKLCTHSTKKENNMLNKVQRQTKKLVSVGIVALLSLTGTIFVMGPARAGDVTLTMYSWRPEDAAFYKAELAQFHSANPTITIVFEPFPSADYQTILTTALAAGKGPDILQVRAYGALNQLVDPGYLSPLVTKEIKGLDRWNKNILDSQRGFTDKRLFGIPFATQSLGIFYNKDLLSKAHIYTAPRSYPEFLKSLDTLKAKGIQPLANGGSATIEQMWGTIAPSFYGGTTFYNDVIAGRKTFSDPAFIKSLDELSKLFPYMPTNATAVSYDSSRALFYSGRAAYFLGGIFELGYFRTNNPKLKVDFMPTPPMTAGGVQYVSSWADGGFAINSKTKSRPEAIKLLNFLASRQFGQAFSDKLAQVSTVPGVHISDLVLRKSLSAQNKYGTPYMMLVGFRYQNPTGSALLQTGIPNLLNGSKTSKQVAEETTKGVATWYKPFAGKP